MGLSLRSIAITVVLGLGSLVLLAAVFFPVFAKPKSGGKPSGIAAAKQLVITDGLSL